jgi:hypothetical protein
MNTITSAPLTATVFAAMTVLLYGCMAYDAASTVVGAGTTVVSTTADVAGDIVTAPFDGDDDSKKAQ